MAYLGPAPANSIIATSDIEDDAVTAAKIAANAVDSSEIAAGAVDLAHMSSESVDEDNLHISNSGSNGQFLSKQSGDSGGLTWAAAEQFANWSQSSGHLTPDNATYGIHLGVSTATAANLLDDYEEGSWTPLMKGGSTDMTTSGSARYQKIGRVVWLYFNISVTNQNSASGNLYIYTLPFTVNAAGTQGQCRLGGGDRVDAITLQAVTGGSQTYLGVNNVSSAPDANAGAATVSNTLGSISPYNNTAISGIFCYEV